MKILVVEDERISAMVLRRILQKMGHEATLAEDGSAAWELLQNEEFQLVISDWMMPEVDGLELCRRLRNRSSDSYVYFILLSAKDAREDRLIGMDAGADDFLVKPVDEPELAARLRVAERILAMQGELRRQSSTLSATNEELEKKHSDLAEANNRLLALASTDSMTGLANHRTFQERLRSEIGRSLRYYTPLSILLLDVDHFKKYNDSFGHPAGDEVLKGVSRLLKESLRGEDFTARYGGEEFAAILPQTSVDAAHALAERFRAAVAGYSFPNRQITVSIGLAEFTPGEDTAEILITKSDEALYAAKRSGRNRIYLADDLPFIDASEEFNGRRGHADAAAGVRRNLEGVLKDSADQILSGVLSALEQRQAESQGHSQRVVQIALRLAQQAGVLEGQEPDSQLVRELVLGSLLHDIGKTTVPPEILHKSGPLTEEERQTLRMNPIMGIDLLEQHPALSASLTIIRHQHERFDGMGYPDHLASESIPLSARIFSLANAYDTMRHERPYRAALNYEDAVCEIEEHTGTQFDPRLVAAFKEIPAVEWDELLRVGAAKHIEQFLPKAA